MTENETSESTRLLHELNPLVFCIILYKVAVCVYCMSTIKPQREHFPDYFNKRLLTGAQANAKIYCPSNFFLFPKVAK